MKKKLILIAACCLVTVVVCCSLFGCATEKTAQEEEKTLNFLVLGDSIGEALLGPSPLSARDQYAYCTLIGKVNGYSYHNRAVSGHQTGNLLDYISRPADDSAYTHISLIKNADIIDISILGNDFLLADVNRFAKDGMQGDFSRAENILAGSYENICAIIDRIYELNPDVTLIMQTLYNPLFEDSIMFSEEVKAEMKEKGVDAYELGGALLNRLNDVLYRYLIAHPYKFYIADVNSKFNYAYQQGVEYLDRYMYADCVHPSNEGHAAIFTTIQTVLEQIGLADHNKAIANYKALVTERLKTYYSGTKVDVQAISAAIWSASTYDQINSLYFDATLDVVPQY